MSEIQFDVWGGVQGAELPREANEKERFDYIDFEIEIVADKIEE